MNTEKMKTFNFAGSIQRNFSEYLEAAITFHYAPCDAEEVKELPDEDIKYDALNIADNLIREADAVEYPDGSVYTREKLEEAIVDQIREIYPRSNTENS